MRAVKNETYGSPQVLKICDMDRPAVGPRDILVEVCATTVTQGDRRLRAADYPGLSAVFGRLIFGVFRPRQVVGGSNFSGRVVEAGQDVTRFSVGDDVFGSTDHGAYAEYLVIAEDGTVAPLPTTTSYAEAAALPYGGVTALAFLRDIARVQPGERVLVVGASGGVGRQAVSIAKHLGAHVTGVCGSDAEVVRNQGADDVIDYRRGDFTERGEKWDVIFDTTEGNHFRDFKKALTETGRYLTLYVTVRVLLEMLFTNVRRGPRALCGVAMGDAQQLMDLGELADTAAVRDPIAARFPLVQASDAHALLENEAPHGSIVIDVVRGAAASRTAA